MASHKEISRKGGKAGQGKAKARTTEQARNAALKRWEKTMKITLPEGWEKCRTGIKGVRKWRDVKNGCWVTEMDDDKETLHCGAFGKPIKVDRTQADVQKTINALAVMAMPVAAIATFNSPSA